MKLKDVINTFDPSLNRIVAPYIIAEAGVNHEGDMNLAKRLIEEASEGGAHAIKFQTYKAETIASKNSPYYWDLSKEPTTSQFELFKKYDKFWKNEFEILKLHCDKHNIEFLSTPFDFESAIFLNDLMDVFKISSSDLTNKPFIEFMCDFKKPVILSTGASNLAEIQESVGWIKNKGNPFSLLHCVLNYPCENKNANLGMILSLKKEFPKVLIGYSDHTLPEEMRTLETSVLLGAQILEKHFSHDKTLPGNDHYHAMDMHDLKKFHKQMNETFTLLGSFDKHAIPSEEPARKNARRSIVASRAIPKGKKIETSDLTFKRPATGISPKRIDEVLGKTAAIDIEEDRLIEVSDFV